MGTLITAFGFIASMIGNLRTWTVMTATAKRKIVFFIVHTILVTCLHLKALIEEVVLVDLLQIQLVLSLCRGYWFDRCPCIRVTRGKYLVFCSHRDTVKAHNCFCIVLTIHPRRAHTIMCLNVIGSSCRTYSCPHVMSMTYLEYVAHALLHAIYWRPH